MIGNGSYRMASTLPNPINDASDMAAALGRLGFSVSKIENVGFDAMRRALLDFGRRARAVEMALVFFAGDGMERRREWLMPVDAAPRQRRENEAIGLRSVMLTVSAPPNSVLVILDACRNNPFAVRMQRASAVRSVDRGLARIEPTGSVLVAYAARDGTTASDGPDRNSPFTAALLRHIETPGLEVNFLFHHVRRRCARGNRPSTGTLCLRVLVARSDLFQNCALLGPGGEGAPGVATAYNAASNHGAEHRRAPRTIADRSSCQSGCASAGRSSSLFCQCAAGLGRELQCDLEHQLDDERRRHPNGEQLGLRYQRHRPMVAQWRDRPGQVEQYSVNNAGAVGKYATGSATITRWRTGCSP